MADMVTIQKRVLTAIHEWRDALLEWHQQFGQELRGGLKDWPMEGCDQLQDRLVSEAAFRLASAADAVAVVLFRYLGFDVDIPARLSNRLRKSLAIPTDEQVALADEVDVMVTKAAAMNPALFSTAAKRLAIAPKPGEKMQGEDEWLSKEAAAEHCGCTVAQIRGWTRRKRNPCEMQVRGGKQYVRLADVQREVDTKAGKKRGGSNKLNHKSTKLNH